MFKLRLDNSPLSRYSLNMFKLEIARAKSPETKAHILQTAIRIFRERGLENSTMREIATASGVALGAAYYYFSSKEAIIQAYYDGVQAEHTKRVAAALAGAKLDLKARLRLVFHLKLDILQHDRKLLGALFRYTGEPEHPLSSLGSATSGVREQSMTVFSLAIGEERLPNDIRTVLPSALWALQMAILLYFIYDESAGQERTRKLIDGILTILVRVLALAKLSVLKPIRGSVFSLLRDAELLPNAIPQLTLSQKE
jgi:AcrR family transcriptional regulator